MKTFIINFKSVLLSPASLPTGLLPQKILILVLIGLMGILKGEAQSFSAGLKAGGNYSDFSKFQNDKNVLLYHAGAYLTIALNSKLAMQLEGSLSRQGFNRSNEGDFKERTMYINTPLLLKYKIAPRFHLVAGGRLGLLLSAKQLLGEEESGKDKIDIKKDYKSIEAGGIAGLEIAITNRISIEGTANIGFASNKDEPDQNRQNLYQFSAAYRLLRF